MKAAVTGFRTRLQTLPVPAAAPPGFALLAEARAADIEPPAASGHARGRNGRRKS
jgi:hypothetical protein